MSDFKSVLLYCLAKWNGCAKRPALSEKDQKLAEFINDIGESVTKGDYEVLREEFATHFEDDSKNLDWDPGDEKLKSLEIYPDAVQVPSGQRFVQFTAGEYVELSEVDKAVKYYGSKKGTYNNGHRIRPSLESINRKFRFIKDKNHVSKLLEYEKNGYIKANRKISLELISTELEKEARKHIEEGKILHDSTLRFLIRGIIKERHIDIPDFIGSDSWLNGWKKRYGLSSRKITKFVATVRHKSREQIEKDSKEFVATVNQLFPNYPLSNIYNADQSGFQLEMPTARTLTFTGLKHVHCVVQSVSSTTHSYTVLPLISASGKLHPVLFVTLKEKNGQFPAKGHFQASNLVVTCHSSHIMTKVLMKKFFETVMFHPDMPKDALLIVDSWNSWGDKEAIDSVTPSSNKLKVMMIPAGCTGNAQPCDVGIFGGFKKVVKTISGQAQLTNPDYKMHTRDETLKMLSLVWWQLCSPKLESWAQYAWFASGYAVSRPSSFLTPAQLLFPRNVARDCAATGCTRTSFIKCAYCEDSFCFDDFFINYHKCC